MKTLTFKAYVESLLEKGNSSFRGIVINPGEDVPVCLMENNSETEHLKFLPKSRELLEVPLLALIKDFVDLWEPDKNEWEGDAKDNLRMLEETLKGLQNAAKYVQDAVEKKAAFVLKNGEKIT